MKSRKKLTPVNIALLIIVIFFVTGYIAYPLLSLVRESLAVFESGSGMGSFYSIVSSSVFNSIILSLITVAGSCIIGVYLAYKFQFRNFPLKNLLFTLMLIPIAMPPLVGVVAFLFLLNENGLLIKVISMIFNLQTAAFKFDGWSAIIIVHIYSFYPFFLLFVSSALKKTDANLIDASYSLGAGRNRFFLKVILPQLMPSVIGASLIVFMASMASFSAPFIFGGSSKFLTTEIYSSKINGDTSTASMLSILLTIISLGFLILLRRFRKKNTFEAITKGTARSTSFLTLMNSGWKGTVPAAIFAAVVMLPILAMLFLSLIPEGSLMRNYFTEPFTSVNYEKVLGDPQFFEPFSNSLKMAVLAVVITLLIGVSAAFLITRKKLMGGNILESLLSLPYGIPGTVIALSFIICFNTPTLFTGFIPIVGTFWILPLAYSVRNLPVITQSSISGFNSFDPSLEEASATLGAYGSRTFRKVMLPLVFPAILSGAMLVFINSIGEFVSTILLYTFSTKTISVEIYSQLRLYNTGAAAAYGIILFMFVMIIVYVSRSTLDKSVGSV